MSEEKSCGNCEVMDHVGEDDPCPNLRDCVVNAPPGMVLRYWRPKKPEKKFTAQEVEKLIEQAYLNGIAASSMARFATGRSIPEKGYKGSTAYYEYQQMLKRG